MRIGLEASWVQGQPSGVGHYAWALVQAMARAAPQHEYVLLHWSRQWTGPAVSCPIRTVSYHCGPASLAVQCRLNRVLAREAIDLYHATAATGVPWRCQIPVVATIHDLFRFHPDTGGSALRRAQFRRQLATTLRQAQRLLCNSHCTARELTARFPEVADRTLVTPLGVEPLPIVQGGAKSHLLYVGGIEPRKNPLFLVAVYQALRERWPETPPLVMVGPDRGQGQELRAAIAAAGLASRISYRGYVARDEVLRLLGQAVALLMPSRNEGFGLPLLEAMAAGVPVLASDIPIFREVVGPELESWLLPEAVADWTAALHALLNQPESTRNRIEQGRQLAATFSWKRCAEQTLAVYEQIIGRRHALASMRPR